MSAPDSAPAWFRALTGARIVAGIPPQASDVCLDSRAVTPGAVFVAVRGANFDGHAFIGDAVQRGAVAVIAEEGSEVTRGEHPFPVPAIVAVPDTRVALAQAAAGFFGHPARQLGTVGVTGTDGKTTTTHLIAHVLNATGRPAGYLSSVEFGLPASAELNASHMTTLEAPAVQRHLARVRDAGARYAVVEASSHGLDMHRVDECAFDVGVFTNLTADHLDYHGTMERYRDAKAALFRMLGAAPDKGVPRAAILNADDATSAYMRAQTRVPALTYGLRTPADFTASAIAIDADGTRFDTAYRDARASARMTLLGAYNVSNALAAVAVAVSQGAGFADAVSALASFGGVPGRMEVIAEGQPFRVVVDIASTEQAMRNVLSVLRPATPGRLIVVFGAAGERDRERRGGIARSVAATAHEAIVTNEDPRSEDPGEIIDEIASALAAQGMDAARVARVPDRRQALASAFARARAGDTVLLAGKGTEQSIVIGTTHHPWDERAVARALLRERFGV